MGKNMTELKKVSDIAGEIIRWEGGELNQTEIVELFQNLIDTGLAWELQGTYGRTAKRFLDAGLCHTAGPARKVPGPKPAGPRPLSMIASEIRRDWGAKVNYAAVPYLKAMGELHSISETYMYDSAASCVLYFLSNATTWRGDVARRVKAELKAMLKAQNV